MRTRSRRNPLIACLAIAIVAVASCSDKPGLLDARSGQSDSLAAGGQRVATLGITPPALTRLEYHDTVRLHAAAFNSRGDQVDDAEIRWSTSDHGSWRFVANVDAHGNMSFSDSAAGTSALAYPFDDGSSVISAAVGAVSASVSLSVYQKAVTLRIVPNPIDAGSDEDVIYVDALDSHGSRYFYDGRNLTLTSSDSTVAFPQVGGCIDGDCGSSHLFVYGRRPGSASIVALLVTGYGTLTDTARVMVNAVPETRMNAYHARLQDFATSPLAAAFTRLNPAYPPWTAPMEVPAASRAIVDSAARRPSRLGTSEP